MLVSLGVSRDFTTAASEVKGQRHRGTASKGGGEGGRRGGDISLGRNGQLNRLRTQKVTVEVIRHKSPSSAGRFFSSSSALFFFLLLFLPTPPPPTHTHSFSLLFSSFCTISSSSSARSKAEEEDEEEVEEEESSKEMPAAYNQLQSELALIQLHWKREE